MKFVCHYVLKRPQAQAVRDLAEAALEKAIAALSTPLAQQRFLVGDRLSIPEIGHMPCLGYLAQTAIKERLAKFPHVVSCWGRLLGTRKLAQGDGPRVARVLGGGRL
jgi:glutathione S-transferase